MAYWFGGSGNFSDAAHWSNNSGNVPASLLGHAPTSSDDAVFDTLSNATAYTVTVDATVNCSNCTIGNPLSGVLTFTGGSTLNIFGNLSTAAGVLATYLGNLTMAATSGTKTITSNSVVWAGSIIFNGIGGTFQLVDDFNLTRNVTLTNGSFDPNGKTFTMSGAIANQTITGAFTFYNLSKIPSTPSKTDLLVLANDITIANLFTINPGATVTNRVLVQSNTVGTPRTITAASISISTADFMDITGAGAASWDMSAASGGSGNCGGNTMKALGDAAFTTSADQHWTNVNGGNWSTSGNWTSRVPLPQDNVFLNCAFGTSKTVSADMPRMGKNIDFAGATWTTALTFSHSSIVNYIFGSLIFIPGITISGTQTFYLQGRATNLLINTGGITFTNQWSLEGCVGGKYTLASNFINTNINEGLLFADGELDMSTFNITVSSFSHTFISPRAKTLTMGSGTFEMNGAYAYFNATASLFTINCGTSTIKFTPPDNNGVSFAGGNKTYYNIWFNTGVRTGANSITGSNTFNDFKDDGTVAHSILFTAASTQRMNTFCVSGSIGNLITLNSTTTGIYNLIKLNGGIILRKYLNIQHSVATPAKTWYAGYTSINNQGVASAGSGWIFRGEENKLLSLIST